MPRPALGTQGAGRPECGPAFHLPTATRQRLVHLTCSVRALGEKGTRCPCFGVLLGWCKCNRPGPGGVNPSAHEADCRPHPGVLPLFIRSVRCWTVFYFLESSSAQTSRRARTRHSPACLMTRPGRCCQSRDRAPQAGFLLWPCFKPGTSLNKDCPSQPLLL